MSNLADKIALVIITIIYAFIITIGYFFYERKPIGAGALQQNPPALQHIVLIKYKSETSNKILYDIENAANALAQIPGVYELTYGNNVSPEGFDQGFTHSLTMAFQTAKDRDSIYLPHPIHTEFGAVFAPNVENFVVYDYWK
tara:strand:- start:894 stop:1319 length:426 start_codon:yes stop_codon:yes gene_type:complete